METQNQDRIETPAVPINKQTKKKRLRDANSKALPLFKTGGAGRVDRPVDAYRIEREIIELSGVLSSLTGALQSMHKELSELGDRHNQLVRVVEELVRIEKERQRQIIEAEEA